MNTLLQDLGHGMTRYTWLTTAEVVTMASIGVHGTNLAQAVGVALLALLASWFPARRAARIDPLIALRSE